VEHEFILEAVDAAFKKRNERIASKLSLIPNSPDVWRRNRFEQEQDRLERSRPTWQDAESLMKLGDEVLIPAGTPVGLVPMGAYITQEPIIGVLARAYSLRGGSGYMESGRKIRDSLVLINKILPLEQGQKLAETVGFLVPNDMFEAIPQTRRGNSSNT
jgi:hypothetical protein